MKYLQLSCLPNMASFCLGDHNLEFPILEKMIVRECPKMKIFCQGDLSTPQLQKVILTEDGDEENGQWEGDLKTTIKRMIEEEVSGHFLIGYLLGVPPKGYRIPSIEELQDDRFATRSVDESLQKFCISAPCRPVLVAFDTSTSTSKISLKTLNNFLCVVLGSLVAEHLQFGCIEGLHDDVDKYLQLSGLPTLASFCLGDHNFEFPALGKMIVRECPKMKIFCQGYLSTPQLQKVIWTKDEDEENGWWEGDLKTTITRMFEEKVAKRCAKLPLAIATVARALRNKSLYAWNDALRLLHCDAIGLGLTNGVNTVEEARNSSLAFVLKKKAALPPQLNMISCLFSMIRVEEIVSKEEGLETVVTFVFDQVSYLCLLNLPELVCFYLGVHATEWPMLKRLNVLDCGNMKILGIERLSIPDKTKVDGQLESTLILPPLSLAK
ncbi:hypothetical protein POUND7_000271, partial [Theobroma cacao]